MEKRIFLATLVLTIVASYTFLSFSIFSDVEPSQIDVAYPLRYHRDRFNILSDDAGEHRTKSGGCHMMFNSDSCNTLPNYFLYPSARLEYRNAAINFVHIAKTGGDTMRSCLRTLADVEGLWPPVTVDFNYLCKEYYATRSHEYADIAMGHCAFGMCDVIRESQPNRKCSSFTLLRDPFDRMTSHYFYLRQCANTSMVSNVHARNSLSMTLADWALLIGSETRNKFFRQEKLVRYPNGSRTCTVESEPMRAFENDSYLDNISQNLDKHFGVIGLTSEYELTLKMLQEAYGIPFYDSCKDLLLNKGHYDNKKDVSMREIKANAVKELKKDKRVQRMLHLDVKVYEKAKAIFSKQKESMQLLT